MNNMTLNSLMPVLPELFLAVAGMALLIVGVLRGNSATKPVSWAVMWSFVIAAFFLLGNSWDRTTLFGDMFVLDQFSRFMKLVILLGLTASVALSVRYLYQENMARFEFPLLILFAGIGMMLMVSANNLLALYVGLELQSLSLYVLAAFHRDHAKSAEAGMKYFVLGALASGMLLFGCSLMYGFAGTLDYAGIDAALSGVKGTEMGMVIGLVFILAGIAFKISAVPFHMWTPDVYEGSPTAVTALFAIVPKVAAMAVLMRLLFGPLGSAVDQWQQVIWFLAAASMFIGAFAGIAQDNIKRLMAYSSIGNMGYALMGVAAGTENGAGAVIVYMTLYMIMSAGVFGIILMMRRNAMAAENISDLSGLSRTNPAMAYALVILLFSMTGIPPMAGFFGKLMVFQAAMAAELYTLAVIGVLSSVVAAFYYLRIIKVMFFDDAMDPFDKQIAFAKRAVIAVSVVIVMVFILSPGTLIESGRAAASALFTG
jgi:NADH-quinone oxidoreductase subunit N